MRARSRVAFAPFIRGVLIFFSLLFLIPGIITVVITSFEGHVEGTKKVSSFVLYGWLLSMGVATFLTYSTPKGKQAAEDGFFVGVALTNAALATSVHTLLDELDTETSLNLALFAIVSAGLLPLLRVTRAYIAMHSDAHIEEHLIKCNLSLQMKDCATIRVDPARVEGSLMKHRRFF